MVAHVRQLAQIDPALLICTAVPYPFPQRTRKWMEHGVVSLKGWINNSERSNEQHQ
jgi:hypothetical protein